MVFAVGFQSAGPARRPPPFAAARSPPPFVWVGVGWIAFSSERGCDLEWLTMVGPRLSMVWHGKEWQFSWREKKKKEERRGKRVEHKKER